MAIFKALAVIYFMIALFYKQEKLAFMIAVVALALVL